jgi:D-alanyl-lipoteichoic acid acyltransferase DltB (MBOAT superfamily)
MLWGFFKKMVVADNLAILVDVAYNNPSVASGPQLLLATYFFAVQIYCDFSGYTDIAIGCARMFDLHMTRNFAYPYFAASIPEFWRRWHITLSNWFRDYLYIPLGGNRVSPVRKYANVMIVFLVSGLWHGANWTFLIWGLLHGVFFLVYERFGLGGKSGNIGNSHRDLSLKCLVLIFINFQLVCFAWVFFRANSLQDSVAILRKIFSGWNDVMPIVSQSSSSLLLVVVLFVVEWLSRFKIHPLQNDHWPVFCRWATYYVLVISILLLSPVKVTPFIYFQF